MKILRITALLCLFVALSNIAIASRILGGNITWECSGGSNYTLTLRLYTDCFGATAAVPTENLYCVPSGCAGSPINIDLNLVSVTEVSELCPAELINSSCAGGIIPGTNLLVYTASVTLDPTCQWKFFWNESDWNYANNINYTSLPNAYITSRMFPAFGCLNSIDITSLQSPYECVNNGVITNTIAVSGAAGYTLSYALSTPQTSLDPNDPLGPSVTVPGFANINALAVNATTGAVSFNSTGVPIGNYLATIEITIRQGANIVGVIYENMVFVMRDCTSSPTDFQLPAIQNLSPTASLSSPTSIDVCAGDSLCFSVLASNPNTQRTVTITSSHPAALNAGNPVFELDTTVLNPRLGTFCMATTGAMVGGPYIINFDATDNACVLPGFDNQQISVTIYPSVTLSVTDTLLCVGSTLPVTASGGQTGATYTWTVLSGDATPGLVGNSGVQNLNTLNSDTEIEVVLNGVPAQCNARDTLTVGISLSDVTLNITNETCIQNDGAIDALITGGTGIYTYAWDNGAITQDLLGISDGPYCLTVTDTGLTGCSVQECGTVLTTLPPAGTLSAVGATTICQGGSATLQFTATGSLTEPYFLTVTGAGATVPASINHNGTFTVSPPVGTTIYTLTNTAYVNFPACSTPANSQVSITVRPTVTGQFLPAAPICSGLPLNLQVDFSQAGSYDVTYTATPADPASAPNPAPTPWSDLQILTFNPAVTTTYAISNVQYTTAPLCPSTVPSNVLVTVHPLPTATLTGSTTVCAGNCANLNLSLTGTGPYTINYTINGTPGTLTNITSPFVWNQCPAGTSTYVITSVTDANGCTAAIVGQSQTITVQPFPAFTFTGSTSICTGSATNLVLTPTSAGGPYDIVLGVIDTDPGTPSTLSLTSFAGGNYSVSPTVATTYELQSIIYTGAPACAVTPLTTVAITVSQPPLLLNIAQNCNNISTAYTVSFTITGAAPFTVNGLATGANYVSPAITSGTGATFTVDDGGACPALVYNSPLFSCPILTDAGTMSTTALSICGTNAAIGVSNNNAVFDGNDEQTFVLHTGAGSTLGTIIAQDCNDANFGDIDSPLIFSATPAAGAVQYGVTYYISSVVGDDDGTGDCVNLAAANVDVSPGQPVTWFQSPTASIGGNLSICAGGSASIPVSFTGQAPWTFVYSLGGVNQAAITTSTNPFLINATVAGAYALVSVASVNCTGTVAGTANLVVQPLPTAQLSASTSICVGACTNLTLTLTGTGPWQVNYTINGLAQAPLNVAVSPFLWNVCPTTTSAYCITSVTDANPCSSGAINVCSTVTVNALPTSSITSGGSFCAGGTLSLPIVFTGTGPFNYTVNTPTGTSVLTAAGNTTFAANAPGNYFISNVSDANCPTVVNSATVVVTQNALPTASINANGIICAGQTFSFNYTLTGAAPFTYTLDAPVTDLVGQVAANAAGSFVASDAGNYTITSVTDNNGCVSAAPSNTATLTVNPLPVATVGTSGSICAGNTYNFTVNLTTGTGPFDYTITTPSGDVIQSNVTSGSAYTTSVAGNYFITSVTDANSCTNPANSASVALTVNPLPTATFGGNAAFCQGQSATLNLAFTGTGPWNYTITTPGGDVVQGPSAAATATFNAAAAGNYFITSITDALCANSTDSPSITVTQNALPTATLLNSGSICTGQTYTFNYTLTGQAPYTFNLNAPVDDLTNQNALTANGSFTDNDAGNYIITSVTDNNGCTSAGASNTATLVVNPLPVATLSADAAICANQTHSFALTLATGTGPFDYTITTPAGDVNVLGATTGDVYNATVAGNYFVTSVTDANACTNPANSNTSILTVHPLPTASWVNADTAFCAGGSVNMTILCTGSAPWTLTYTIGGVPQTINIAASPFVLSATQAGIYCITQVTDNNGCIGLPNDCVTVTAVPVPTANAGLDLSTCSGVPVQVGTAGVVGVTYAWTNGFGLPFTNATLAQPSLTPTNGGGVALTDFCALTASITASGITCAVRDTVLLTVNPLPTITASALDATICFGESTSITAAGAGAGGTYAWTAEPTITGALGQASTTVEPIGIISYTVEGTDANGCENTASISVQAGTPLLVAETFTNFQCFDVCEGTITLTPSGSYGTYGVTWGTAVPNATAFSQTGLCAGNYPYEVTDAQGCSSGNFTIIIDGLPENFVDDVVITPPTCAEDLNGSLQIIEGAVDYMIYSETGLEFIGPQAGDTFSGLPAGNYDVYVTDINGCSIDSLNIEIVSLSAPISIILDPFTDIFCFQENISFTGSAAGGFGNLVLNWYNCPDTLGCLIGQGTPFPFTILQDTTLYGVISDELGCRSEIANVTAEISDPIQIEITNGDALTICEGECVELIAETQGGNTDLTIQWYELPAIIGDATVGPDGLTQEVCPTVSTGYYAYANDGCNAPASDTINFTVFQTPEVVFEADTTQGCWPLEISFTNLTDPALVDNCVWTFGDGATLNVCGAVTHTYTDTGNFFASLTITSPDGCIATDTLDNQIQVFGYPEIDFSWDPSTIDILAPTVEFTNLTQGGISYDWSFATFATSTETNPSFQFPAIDLATYTVCLESENSQGCRDTLCHDLTVSSILQVWIPNAFTPDGDDINDVWLPILKGYNPDSYRLLVYNRWGTIVFETTDPEEAWLGEIGNGAFYSQTDTFVYRIEVQRLSDNTFEVFEGHVTMLR
jgi:gliding motility-associated-like protein